MERETVTRFFSSPDGESYAALFRAFVNQVTAYFRTRGCRPPADEDLAQDVLFTVYRNSHQLREHHLFRPWLFKIARNALLQHRRKYGGEKLAEMSDHAAPSTDPPARLEFGQWMNALNPDEREAVMLRYVEGLEYHEIATVLDIPTGTVQWRVFQSKKKLAARFAGKG